MDKILLEISCPATSKKYDFWVSKQMNIARVKKKMMSEIREYEKNDMIFNEEDRVMLFCEKGIALQNESASLEQSGVRSGDCLMLV